MAIDVSIEYSGKVIAPDANYPYGGGKPSSGAGIFDGSPWSHKWISDHYAFDQRLMIDAGIVPNNVADTVLASQLIDSLDARIAASSNNGGSLESFPAAEGDMIDEDMWTFENSYGMLIKPSTDVLINRLQMIAKNNGDATLGFKVAIYDADFNGSLTRLSDVGTIDFPNGSSNIQTVSATITDTTLTAGTSYYVCLQEYADSDSGSSVQLLSKNTSNSKEGGWRINDTAGLTATLAGVRTAKNQMAYMHLFKG